MDIKNQIETLNRKASFEYQQTVKPVLPALNTLVARLERLRVSTTENLENGIKLDCVVADIIRNVTHDFQSFVNSLENVQQYASDLQQTNAQLEILREIEKG